ncbi:type VI secretion system baseplate subunit TssG [Paucibacter sp. R3-3]|uniref:Type VI secretion system baseplate subunit TssG n=1 Tax=Roseateles agri TaxID=3098619 RepID=A0ABU5DC36_9BURK|nr:type VI secretion system baseplate subunit TssG [Paucibacter sp. R3-3]MDY0743283.1 type VI secretion system baseplate subunit TssG [Paucibacter sp. R3-3]
MAPQDDPREALWRELQAQPRRHDFFATLRRIEALHPQWPRLGEAPRPSQEALRLGQQPDLDFALAELAALDRPADFAPRLRVLFFGLLGPNGPMPLPITEYTRERLLHHRDPTLARFLDVFHHRLLALFYRSWAQNQPTVQHDRPKNDRFAAWLGACAGLGTQATPPAQLFQAGLLSQRSRHPEGLAKLLTQQLRLPVRIEQHVPQWLDIEAEDRRPLGFAPNRPERSEARMGQLGISANSGRKQLDRQYKFRVVVGPLSKAAYEALLPGTAAWRQLQQWVQLYAGLDMRWDLKLVLAAAQVPDARPDGRLRLGLTSWLGRRQAGRDRQDLRLRPETNFPVRHPGAASHGAK